MFRSLTALAVIISLTGSAPTINNSGDDIVNIIERQNNLDNSIDVDERPIKQVEIDSETPLGSQFAVEFFFPERKNLETGHRIPLHLFPIETQNKILEVEEDKSNEKYVDASSFRQAAPVYGRLTPEELSLRNLFGQEREGDRTYEQTLSVFAPPSFF